MKSIMLIFLYSFKNIKYDRQRTLFTDKVLSFLIPNRFVPPEASDSVKNMIRNMAPLGLLENQSKIRKSIAAVISAIAHWDWPDQWPDLFHTLMTYLRDVKV